MLDRWTIRLICASARCFQIRSTWQSLSNNHTTFTNWACIDGVLAGSGDGWLINMHTTLSSIEKLIGYRCFSERLWRSIDATININTRSFIELWRVLSLRFTHAKLWCCYLDFHIVSARSRNQLVLIILVNVGKVVRNWLLRASLTYACFLATIGCRAWSYLMSRSSKVLPLLLTNTKLRSIFLKIDSLAVASRAWLHFLLPCASKCRACHTTNLELWTSFVFAIYAVNDIIVTWARDILLSYLIDFICLLMYMHCWSLNFLWHNWVATDSWVLWIDIHTRALWRAKSPPRGPILGVWEDRFVLAWSCLEPLSFLKG